MIAHGFARRYHALPMKRLLGIFAYSDEKNCPVCGSNHVHRTRRGRLLEFWVLLFLPFRPYRCGKCRQRFYGPKKLTRGETLDDLDSEQESE
jgi:ribosomal protein L37AE/L43A